MRPDRSRRKELLRQYRAAKHAEARSKLGLTAGELNSLLDLLDQRLDYGACDHSLRLTRAWCAQHGHEPTTVAAALAQFGGACDCEVLANVAPDQFGWPD